MTPVPRCPSCGSAEAAGHVQPDPDNPVYDGVLFWECLDCGTNFHRWPEGDYRHTAAQQYVSGR